MSNLIRIKASNSIMSVDTTVHEDDAEKVLKNIKKVHMQGLQEYKVLGVKKHNSAFGTLKVEIENITPRLI